MAIEWRESLATGHEEIDNQHKELFKRFNNLLTACNKGKGNEEVGNLLKFLSDYVVSHFAAEEQLQIRHNFSGYQETISNNMMISFVTFATFKTSLTVKAPELLW